MNRLLTILLSVAALLAAPVLAGTDGPGAGSGKKDASKKESDDDSSGGEDMTVTEEGLELGNAMVIEGRVEKPQVQFTLLREAPPLRDIRFEETFLPEILRLKRENVPDPGDKKR